MWTNKSTSIVSNPKGNILITEETDADLRSEADIYGSEESLASIQRCSDSSESSCASEDEEATIASETGSSADGTHPVMSVATANIQVRTFSFRPDSVLSLAASVLSIQDVAAALADHQRPLPPVPRKPYAREISVNCTSTQFTDPRVVLEERPTLLPGLPDQFTPNALTLSPHRGAAPQKQNKAGSSLLCCRARKYEKVTEAFPKRKNMSWLLKKKTLLVFSTASLLFSLFSCGMLLYLKLKPLFDHHDCNEKNSTEGGARNLSVTGSMCYENRKILSQIIDSSASNGNKRKTPSRLINGAECSLSVEAAGWFFIYSSVTVNVTNCTTTKQWTHAIVHVPRNDSVTNRTLTQSVRTCCHDCPHYVETSFTGGIYRLEDGDDVYVKLDLPRAGSNQTCISLVNVG